MKQRRTFRRHNWLSHETLESRCLLTTIGDINSGIAVEDDATGVGYLMFSEQDVHTRFSPAPVLANSDHLVAVRNQGGQWQYNDNFNWHNFSPIATDHLLAEVDFGADTLNSFQCVSGSINGIDHGFANDNLSFSVDEWNDEFNTGEFTIRGTTFDKTWTNCGSVLSVTPDTADADFTTSSSSLTIQGRFDLQSGALEVTLIDPGSQATTYTPSSPELTTSGPDWTLDLTAMTLADGTYTVEVGNGQAILSSEDIVVDTVDPFVTITDVSQDTGAADFITTNNRVQVIGTYEQGSNLLVSLDNLNYRLSEHPELTSNGMGTWTLDLSSIPLSGGSYTLDASATDTAGNTVSAPTQSLQIVTASIDEVRDDTGPTDFVTADQQLFLAGSVTPGATLSIDIVGGATNLTGLSPVVSGNSWTLDLTSTTLPFELYTVTAHVTLGPDSTSVSRQLNVTSDCFHADSFELRDPNDNPISSLATVNVDLDGNPLVAIDLGARKTPTSPSNVYFVDSNYTATRNGALGSQTNPYSDIHTAFAEIDAISPNVSAATINVAAGEYAWGYQNNINFDLNIIGSGIGQTIVRYDDALGTAPNNANNRYTAQFRQNSTYIEGITFDGDDGNANTPNAFIVMDVRNADALTIVDSEFKNSSAGGDGLNVFNTDTVVVYNSIAHHNDGDGFSYSNPSAQAMEVFEAFVNGSDNGLNGLWNSQGSTTHESVDIVRVGGVFERNPTNISDVSSGTSWNVDVTTADALVKEQADQFLNFNVSGGGTAWIVGGDHSRGLPANRPTAVNAVDGAQIRYVSAFNTLDPITTVVTGNLVEDNQVLVPNSVPCVASVSIDGISQDTGDPTDFKTYDQQLIVSGSFIGDAVSVVFDNSTFTSASPELRIDGFQWTLDLSGTTLPHGTYEVAATATDSNGGTDTAGVTVTIDCTTAQHALVDVPALAATNATVTVDSQGFGSIEIDLEARKPTSNNVLYVDAAINLPSPTGTSTSPFNDLPDAFDYMRANSLSDAVIHVAEGDYSWGDAINPDTESSLFKASLTIIGAGSARTRVFQGTNDLAAGVFSEGGESLYVEGMSFIGLGNVGIKNFNEHAFEATGGVDLTFVDTVFTGAFDGDGLFVGNFDTVVVYDSKAVRNSADGFSYTKTSDGSPPMYVIEIGVVAAGNGINGEASSQGSTNHRDSEIVRINGVYANNPTNIEDTGFASWNVDVELKNPTVFQNGAGNFVNYRVRGDKNEATDGRAWLISGTYNQGGVIYASDTTANVTNAPVSGSFAYASSFDIVSHPIGTVIIEDTPGSTVGPDDSHLLNYVECSIGESGSIEVSQLNADSWTTVNLTTWVEKPVVFAQLSSRNGADPATVRLRNVTSTSFEVQVDEWDYLDGAHLAETVNYLVIEEGSHVLSDGTRLEAGTRQSDHNWSTTNYGTAFDSVPTVFSQSQTYNGSAAVTTRQASITAVGFDVRLQEEEAADGMHTVETLGYIAIEGGIGTNHEATTGLLVDHNSSQVSFAGTYTNVPLVFSAMQSFNGLDTAVARSHTPTTTGFEVFLEEERSADQELAHLAESVGFLAWASPGVIVAVPPPIVGLAGELLVEQTDQDDWTRVELSEWVSDPVVIAQKVSRNGIDPATLRIRNVTSTSFEIHVDEWDYLDGAHIAESINYLVVAKGSHMLPDGTQIEVGTVQADHTWSTATFGNSFGAVPAVFSLVQTYNETSAVTTRQDNVTANGFDLRLQEEEAADGTHFAEVVGYIAVDVGLGTELEATNGISADHQVRQINLSGTYQTTPIVFSSLQSSAGLDPVIARQSNVTTSGFDAFLEEEKSLDQETDHLIESLAILAVRSGTFLFG